MEQRKFFSGLLLIVFCMLCGIGLGHAANHVFLEFYVGDLPAMWCLAPITVEGADGDAEMDEKIESYKDRCVHRLLDRNLNEKEMRRFPPEGWSNRRASKLDLTYYWMLDARGFGLERPGDVKVAVQEFEDERSSKFMPARALCQERVYEANSELLGTFASFDGIQSWTSGDLLDFPENGALLLPQINNFLRLLDIYKAPDLVRDFWNSKVEGWKKELRTADQAMIRSVGKLLMGERATYRRENKNHVIPFATVASIIFCKLETLHSTQVKLAGAYKGLITSDWTGQELMDLMLHHYGDRVYGLENAEISVDCHGETLREDETLVDCFNKMNRGQTPTPLDFLQLDYTFFLHPAAYEEALRTLKSKAFRNPPELLQIEV